MYSPISATLSAEPTAITLGYLLAAAAVVIAAFFFMRPHILAAITLLASMFAPTLQQAVGLPLDQADEILLIVFVLSVAVDTVRNRRQFRPLPGSGWFLGFIVVAALSGIVNDATVFLMALDAFLLLKGVLFAAAVVQLEWTSASIAKIAKFGAWVIAGLLASAVINLVAPSVWLPIFAATDNLSARGASTTVVGLFGHPGAFGQMMALAAIALLLYRQMIRRHWTTLVLLVGSVAATVLSQRRKAIAGVLAAGIAFWAWKKPVPTLLTLISLAPLAILLLWSEIVDLVNGVYVEYFLIPEASARTALYAGATTLANEQFPLGAGFSKFGSFVAGANYSDVYYQLGLANVWGLQPGGRFLTDTFWPAIFGQAGWIGGAFFVIGLVSLTRHSARAIHKDRGPLVRWIGLVAVFWSIEYAFESVAAPVYSSPPSNLLLFGALAVAASQTIPPRFAATGRERHASNRQRKTPTKHKLEGQYR